MTTIVTRPASVFAKSSLEWQEWAVQFHMDSIVGGKPAGSLYASWQDGAFNDGDARIKQAVIRLAVAAGLDPNGEIPEDVTELAVAQAKANVFERDENGCPSIFHGNMKACFKESASILFNGEKWTGSGKQTKSWVPERIFMDGVGANPKLVQIFNPDGTQAVPTIKERPVHNTGSGRAALSAAEFCQDVVLDFTLRRLVAAQDKGFNESHIIQILECMSVEGLGAERSLGFGTFVVTRFDRLT